WRAAGPCRSRAWSPAPTRSPPSCGRTWPATTGRGCATSAAPPRPVRSRWTAARSAGRACAPRTGWCTSAPAAAAGAGAPRPLARNYRARVHDVHGTTETGPLTVDGRPLRGVRLRAQDGLLHARTPFTGRRELTTDPGEIGADGTVQVRAHPDGAARAGGMLHDPGAVVRVLCSHPMVTGARLRAVPDERSGARTVAEVALRGSTGHDAAPTGEELRALVRDRLGAASVPY